MILFINGSTPYDEKGNMGAFWNDQGKMITEKQDFYLRFLDIMSRKGYPVATMAKRSFVYPTKIPRPSFSDLVIVGYSEGSVVATKVLSLLKKQPYACILLGSADMRYDCNSRSIEDFYLTDVLRRLKNWTDEQIRTEYDQMCQIQKTLLNMDEETFENEYRNSKPYGFGFAMWESFYIDREAGLYDPLPNLLYANIPVLICIGEDDTAMPVVQAKRTFERLKNKGSDKVTFRLIEKEVHQYKKYDVFAIIDTWLASQFRSTRFSLQKSDSIIIEKYARANEIIEEIQSLSNEDGNPAKALDCYQKALDAYPGFPLQYSQWDMLIDKNWIEEKIHIPFKGIDP